MRSEHERLLWVALALTAGFTAAEAAASLLTGSLALLSDAAHMFTDSAALAVSIMALRVARRGADRKRTFGYHRFEILAATFNAVLLLMVAVYILYEAWHRFHDPEPIESLAMLAVALVGLVINFISMRLLHAGSVSSLNVKSAYLEVWSDMLGSLGVVVAALLIRYTGWLWLDPLAACLIGLWVVPRTWLLLKEALNVLLQGVPEGVDLQALETALASIAGVVRMHDLHVWSLTSGRHILSVHLVVDVARCTEQEVLATVAAIGSRFGIHHTTTQVETQGFRCEVEPHH